MKGMIVSEIPNILLHREHYGNVYYCGDSKRLKGRIFFADESFCEYEGDTLEELVINFRNKVNSIIERR